MKKSIGIILMVLLFLSMATGLGFAIGNLVTIKSAEDGKNAYELAVENGFVGDITQWLASLKGENGTNGANGQNGKEVVIKLEDGMIKWCYEGEETLKDLISIEELKGSKGDDGEKVELNLNLEKKQVEWKYESETEWKPLFDLSNLVGKDGEDGKDGEAGKDGADGKSAYELAKEAGLPNTDTVEAWLNSLKGDNGNDGEDGKKVELSTTLTHITWKYEDEGEDAWRNLIEISTLKGADGEAGKDGIDGKSAYEIAKKLNPSIGTELEWIASLKGEKGEKGEDGTNGREVELQVGTESIEWKYVDEPKTAWRKLYAIADLKDAVKGESAYEIAKRLDPTIGTELEWIASLKGQAGADGKYIDLQFGTDAIEWKYSNEEDWKVFIDLASLKGADGKNAYELAIETGLFNGTLEEWLESLKGEKGDQIELNVSVDGKDIVWKYITEAETEWKPLVPVESLNGADGKSAYEIAKELDPTIGSEVEWIASLKGANGADGKQIELDATDTHVVWRYEGEGDDAWRNLYEINSNAGGSDAREVELQYVGNLLQWKYKDETEWKTLVDLSENRETYVVTFISEGVEYSKVEVLDGKKVDKPATDPTKPGYKFVGWFNGDVEWVFVGYSVTENIVLTAKFSAFEAVATVENKAVIYSFNADTVEELEAVDAVEIKFTVNYYEVNNVTVEALNPNIDDSYIERSYIEEGDNVVYTITIGNLSGCLSDTANRLIQINFDLVGDETNVSNIEMLVSGVGNYNYEYTVGYLTEFVVK